jgi:hypothetical protein
VPVLIVSHRPRREHDSLAPLLQKQTRLPVCSGTAGQAARPKPGIAVILSGMLQDGTQGIRPVKRYGGRVLAQDPATARAASAIATGCVDFVLPPHRLAAALIALTMAPGGAVLLAMPSPTGPAGDPAKHRPERTTCLAAVRINAGR